MGPDVTGLVRARDLDRVAALERLDTAYDEGQLRSTEYSERVAAAKAAITLVDLAAVTADLQSAGDPRRSGRPGPRARPTPDRRRRAVIALAAFVAVAVVAVSYGLLVDPPAAPAPKTTSPLVTSSLYTVSGMRRLLDAADAQFGKVTGIHIYPDSAVVRTIDSTSPTGGYWYDYSTVGGRFSSPESYGGLALGSTDAPVDLGDVDVAALVALIAKAPEMLGLTPANVGRATFRVTVNGDDGGEIWMGVNDIGIDSHLVTDLSADVKGVFRCGWGC